MNTPAKQNSVFFPATLTARARTNVTEFTWAAGIQKQAIAAAEPWMKLSDAELWALMFGPAIKRSWMVWSNGHCPSCKKSVPMYEWKIAAMTEPWKLRCPHCNEAFPKNDFQRFHYSGLDEHGVFDRKRADCSLLFNFEHPDPNDPLHKFGVDGGDGYAEGDKRWRFIGAYLIYGQWKQAVLGGIRHLATAYGATGDRAYAHKAGVLLDRVADVYPTFDFAAQGVIYETTGSGQPFAGYVSIYHDSNVETRELVLAYDAVFDAIKDDAALLQFLSDRAKQFQLSNPKSSFADIQRNIENRILRDALIHREKINCNYPRAEFVVALTLSVLGWPANQAEVMAVLDPMLEKATAVDGVTGEKGLVNYSAFATQNLAPLLEHYARIEPTFLRDLFQRHPRLRETFRFFVDTWCLEKYYPLVGDCGWFAMSVPQYVGVQPSPLASAATRKQFELVSMDSFLWRLHETTSDPAFAQILVRGNGGSAEGLPHDLFAADPKRLQENLRQVIERDGATLKLGSVNKQQWHLAILRSGEGEHARALWLHYDTGGAHGHFDGMNIGLFAKGLDLMPDFGYPPVQFGGWESPRALWYQASAAHNTVVVDGKNQPGGWNVLFSGRSTLWADGKRFHAVRASTPEMNDGQRFERTLALVDVSEEDFYIVDIFRVAGGKDHAKFFHSHYGSITTHGLSLKPAPEYGHDTQMRNFACDPSPSPGWSVDWKIEDRYRLLPAGTEVRSRYTDLTEGAQAYTCEGWVIAGAYFANEEAWIPRLMVRRQSEKAPLVSTFISVIEPYEKESNITRIRRLAMGHDGEVALEISLRDGRCDLVIAADPNQTRGMLLESESGIQLDGELCWVRRSASGQVQHVSLCRGRSVRVGELVVPAQANTDLTEWP